MFSTRTVQRSLRAASGPASALAAALTLGLLTGCSGGTDRQEDPHAVVQDWLEAQQNADVKTLAELTSGDWLVESPWLDTRTKGISEVGIDSVDDDGFSTRSARVHWSDPTGKHVQTTLELETVGKKYRVKPPADAIPSLRPLDLDGDWVDRKQPTGKYLDPQYRPACTARVGDKMRTAWCFDAHGNYDYQERSDQLPLIPFGTYEFEAAYRSAAVTGSATVTTTLSTYVRRHTEVDGGFMVRPETVDTINSALRKEHLPVDSWTTNGWRVTVGTGKESKVLEFDGKTLSPQQETASAGPSGPSALGAPSEPSEQEPPVSVASDEAADR